MSQVKFYTIEKLVNQLQFLIPLENGGPWVATDLSELLYPQNRDKFVSPTLTREEWQWLQDGAKKRLMCALGTDEVRAHWKSIVDGVVPFGFNLEEGE